MQIQGAATLCAAGWCAAVVQLDAGVSEQVLLQSRDERSLLVVSYADIKVGGHEGQHGGWCGCWHWHCSMLQSYRLCHNTTSLCAGIPLLDY